MSDDAGGPDPELARLMKQAFLEVPLHGLLGLEVLDVGRPGVATMAIPLRQPALGATGQLHGGVIAVLCDLACAAAATTAATYDHTTTTRWSPPTFTCATLAPRRATRCERRHRW